MSAEAIQVVTQAIESRLKAALKVAGGNNQTTFVGPLDDQSASNAALVLFLYRATANHSMRNDGHSVSPARAGDREQFYTNALPLDLRFLLTVGPREQAGEPESLRLLGYAMQALNDSPFLTGSQVAGEIVRLSLDAVTSEEMSRIWALFPTVNYRTSVLYLASPVWIDPATPETNAPGVVNQDIAAGVEVQKWP